MTEKSTFARRVRAAKPRAGKHEVRNDMVGRLALAHPPHRGPDLIRLPHGASAQGCATIGSADAMTIPEAVAAVRSLALTGCRRIEVLDLRWRNIGANVLNLVPR